MTIVLHIDSRPVDSDLSPYLSISFLPIFSFSTFSLIVSIMKQMASRP